MRMLERTSLLAQFAFTKEKQNTIGVTMILNNNAVPSIYFYNVSLVLYFCRKYVPHEKDFFFLELCIFLRKANFVCIRTKNYNTVSYSYHSINENEACSWYLELPCQWAIGYMRKRKLLIETSDEEGFKYWQCKALYLLSVNSNNIVPHLICAYLLGACKQSAQTDLYNCIQKVW